jgi:cyclase
MRPMIDSRDSRRRFLLQLSALAVGGWSLSHARPLRAQPKLETVRLSDRMVALLGPGANVVAADSGDGVVMVDGGHASWSDAVLRAVGEQFASRPVSTLLNTHWHREQTGCNAALGERGAQIVAHENTKLWLGSEVWVRWSNEKYAPLPKAAQPATTFYESTSLRFGGRTVDCAYLPKAHTDGDICVFFPDENVLVAGGLVSNHTWPIIDWWTGGWTGGMLDGFEQLLEIANDRTRIVPASGPVMSWDELYAQQQMYLVIFDRLQTMLRKALGTDEVLAAKPTAEYEARYGDPTQFVTLAFHSTWRHLRDLHDTTLRNIA